MAEQDKRFQDEAIETRALIEAGIFKALGYIEIAQLEYDFSDEENKAAFNERLRQEAELARLFEQLAMYKQSELGSTNNDGSTDDPDF